MLAEDFYERKSLTNQHGFRESLSSFQRLILVGRDLEERVASETKWKVVVADDQCDSVIRVGLAVVAGALNAPRA